MQQVLKQVKGYFSFPGWSEDLALSESKGNIATLLDRKVGNSSPEILNRLNSCIDAFVSQPGLVSPEQFDHA